jgi:hypothetical protein
MKHVVQISRDRSLQLLGTEVRQAAFLGVSTTAKFREICAWCDAHLSGKYNMDNMRTWRFELVEDAMLFSMVWS